MQKQNYVKLLKIYSKLPLNKQYTQQKDKITYKLTNCVVLKTKLLH